MLQRPGGSAAAAWRLTKRKGDLKQGEECARRVELSGVLRGQRGHDGGHTIRDEAQALLLADQGAAGQAEGGGRGWEVRGASREQSLEARGGAVG